MTDMDNTHPDLKTVRDSLRNIEIAGQRLLNAPPGMRPKIQSELVHIQVNEFQRVMGVIQQLHAAYGPTAQ